MEKILYHGSKIVVEKPLFGYGRADNDYGQGFYCTEDIELAHEWAALDENGGFVNSYIFNDTNLNILELNKDYDVLHWLAILLNNRKVRYSSPIEKRGAQFILNNYPIDISAYDIIIGYRADDSYFSFSRAFLSNTITLEQLSYAMKYGDLGYQVFIKSRKAFENLIFKGAEPVDGNIYFPKRKTRDQNAREAYQKLLEKEDSNGIYLNELIRAGTIMTKL